MKKILTLLITLSLSLFLFAEDEWIYAKFYFGTSYLYDLYTIDTKVEDNKNKIYGMDRRFGFNAKMDLKLTDYFYDKADFSITEYSKTRKECYWRIENEFMVKFCCFYLSNTIDFGLFEQYADVSVGVNFSKDLFNDWLTLVGDFKAGYVPLNVIGRPHYNNSWDNSKCFITALKLEIKIKDYVTLYGAVDCTEIKTPSGIHFIPMTVKNKVGAKVQYFWNHVGIYGSVDYYCMHPEYCFGETVTDSNQNKSNISVGTVMKF